MYTYGTAQHLNILGGKLEKNVLFKMSSLNMFEYIFLLLELACFLFLTTNQKKKLFLKKIVELCASCIAGIII